MNSKRNKSKQHLQNMKEKLDMWKYKSKLTNVREFTENTTASYSRLAVKFLVFVFLQFFYYKQH